MLLNCQQQSRHKKVWTPSRYALAYCGSSSLVTPCLIPGSFKVEWYCNYDFSSVDGTSLDRQGHWRHSVGFLYVIWIREKHYDLWLDLEQGSITGGLGVPYPINFCLNIPHPVNSNFQRLVIFHFYPEN